MNLITSLVVAVLAVGVTGWQYWRRQQQAVADVDGWIRSAGLPAEGREEAVRRQVRRTEAMTLGGLVGFGIGIGVLIAVRGGYDGIGYLAALGATGYGAGAWLVHVAALHRDRGNGPRAASLRPRRLLDYLSPAELVVQYGMLVLPAMAVAVAVPVFSDGQVRAGVQLVGGAVAGLVLFALGVLVQRRALTATQSAASENALRWEDAARAQMLRDSMSVALTGAWGLGGLVAFGQIVTAPERYPDLAVTAVPWIVGLCSVAMVAVSAYFLRPMALRRSQRQYGPLGVGR